MKILYPSFAPTKQMNIQKQANNQFRLEVDGVSADCLFNLTQEQFENRTRLYAGLSNGRNAEIKIMPDTIVNDKIFTFFI